MQYLSLFKYVFFTILVISECSHKKNLDKDFVKCYTYFVNKKAKKKGRVDRLNFFEITGTLNVTNGRF